MKCFSAALVDVKLQITGLKMKIVWFLLMSGALGFPAERQLLLQLQH